MDDKQIAAEAMVRRSALDSLRGALDTAAAGLQRSARRLAQLADSVDDIGRSRPGNPRILTADGLLTEALATLGRNAPDLANLALAVEQYNRHGFEVDGATDSEGCQVCLARRNHGTECVPGLIVCFGHLWALGIALGPGHLFTLGSPEPTVQEVPPGVALAARNGVHWTRRGERWHAGGPVGDGGLHAWSAVNGADRATGSELARVVPEVVR